MSNNAVVCVSNNSKTIRLTVYRCKPHIFLAQLATILAVMDEFDIDGLVMALIENGFDLDAETSASFTPADMTTNTLVNWAWHLKIDTKELFYWDVTAALNGLLETIEQESLSPLDFCNWMASDAVEDYKTQISESESKLNNSGITLVNY